jgi:Acetoacetate decarboxylase (ADC)
MRQALASHTKAAQRHAPHSVRNNTAAATVASQNLAGAASPLGRDARRSNAATDLGVQEPGKAGRGTHAAGHQMTPIRFTYSPRSPNFMIKIIPHVDCTPRICELVCYHLQDITIKGAWRGPAALEFFEACSVRRCAPSGARGYIRLTFRDRPYSRTGRSRLRLSEKRMNPSGHMTSPALNRHDRGLSRRSVPCFRDDAPDRIKCAYKALDRIPLRFEHSSLPRRGRACPWACPGHLDCSCSVR